MRPPYPEPMLLHRQFIATAKARGTKLALADRTTNRRLSYAQALAGALLLARRLRRYAGDYLGIMLPNSAGGALSVVGALLAGKVPVMINYSTGAENNARYAQSRCDLRTILASAALLEKTGCPRLDGMVLIEELMGTVSTLERLRAGARARLPYRLLARTLHGGDPDDTAVILFTSGSEREPKAVELTHRSIGANVRAAAQAFAFADTDVVLAVLPLFHVFGLTTNLWLPLTLGLSVVTYANPLEFKTVSRIIREERPTILLATPYFLAGYLRQAQRGDFASLRVVVAGADAAPAWLRAAYEQQQGLIVYEGYGTTETSPVIAVNLPGAHKPGSVGRPLPGVQVKIADIASGGELACGREGKILVKGELVMKGYLGDAEETALRMQDGWYDTGDIGVLDEEGFLWHRGRLKRFVKIGGEMVSLPAVENALQEVLGPEVECCVIALPDPHRGARLAVALARAADTKRLLARLGERLPALAMPREFFVLDELPKMGSGKIDFRRTTELVLERIRDRPER